MFLFAVFKNISNYLRSNFSVCCVFYTVLYHQNAKNPPQFPDVCVIFGYVGMCCTAF